MSRFDYVKYDEKAAHAQAVFKEKVTELEGLINVIGGYLPKDAQGPIVGREKALALTKLEEVYMWIGKAIRNEQVFVNAQTQLQEDRNNS